VSQPQALPLVGLRNRAGKEEEKTGEEEKCGRHIL